MRGKKEVVTTCSKFGKTLKPGQAIMSSNCIMKMKCNSNGAMTVIIDSNGKGCPPNSRCKNFACECKAGFVLVTKSSMGLLTSCRRAHMCSDRFNTYQLDQQWLQNDCKRKKICTKDGIGGKESHTCPAHSICDNSNYYGVCKCDTGYDETSRDSKGFLEGCKEAIACRDSQKGYKLNQQWLQNDCKRKYICKPGGIRGKGSHECPAHSSCDNSNHYGVCKCDEGYTVTSRDSEGFLEGCRKPFACRDTVKGYSLNQQWLQNDCKRKYICTTNGIRGIVPHECPAHSSCDNSNYYGVCKCDEGYAETSRDSEGFLEGCRKRN